jgi:hypothetical protein
VQKKGLLNSPQMRICGFSLQAHAQNGPKNNGQHTAAAARDLASGKMLKIKSDGEE